MASSDQPTYPQSSYLQPQSSSNVFYENEVKKDSEIMLRDAEVQQLLQQNRELDLSQQQHLQQQLQHQQQQQLLQQPVKSEPMLHSPEKMAPVSSSTSETSPNLVSSPRSPNNDKSRLSQSDKSHMCLTCFKGFRNKPQLTQHELVHNNVRKHVCTYCEKSFKQICHLNQHIRVHTGDRPYKCDVEGCGRSFAQLSNLNHHKKNHEEHVRRDVSRQFRCDVCERSYATKSSLNTHVQKLHSNVKLDDPSLIQSTFTTTPKKRKKNQEGRISEQVGNEPSSFVMECDSDDDGLPTQVKVKSRFGPKPSLSVRIGTPPGNGERDKNRQAPRTTLPLPFTTNHSQSSPVSLYQQSQGQDNFITTYSDSVSQGQGHREMLQSQHPQNLYSPIDSLSHSNPNLHENPQLLHLSATNTKQNDGQNEELKLLDELSKSEALIAERRKQMQAAISHREALLNSSRLKADFGQIDLQISQAATSISQIPGVSSDSMSSADRLPIYGSPPGQISQSIQSDVPSHIAHHYPKTNSTNQNRVGSQAIFNPAFTEQNQSQNRYDQNQY